MKKILTLLFLLISFNCFASDYTLEEDLILEDCFAYYNNENSIQIRVKSDLANLSVRRFITVLDELEKSEDPIRKEILKINLITESNIVQKYYRDHIQQNQKAFDDWEKKLAVFNESPQNLCSQIKMANAALKSLKEDTARIQERLQLVNQIITDLIQ